MSGNSCGPPKIAPRLDIASAIVLALAGVLGGCEQGMALPREAAALAAIDRHANGAVNAAASLNPWVETSSDSSADSYIASPVEPLASTPATDELTLAPRYGVIEPLSPEAKANREALAQEVANPIADLASLPLRWTYQKDIGPKKAYAVGMVAQPLIPFSINADWNLIAQTNVPINYVSSPANGIDSSFGMGDILQAFYLVPVEPSRRGWVFGVGPAFQ